MLHVNRFLEAANLHFFLEADKSLLEGNDALRDEVLRMIRSEQYWDINQYEEFLTERDKSDKIEFFTPYTVDDLKRNGVTTYKLHGFSIGYALVPMGGGKVDIISVFNNEPEVRGIIDDLLDSAIRHGGNCLDHYDTKLSDLYQRNGFVEDERYKWDDAYMHPKWDKSKWGEPDVVVRHLEPSLRKTLQLSRDMEKY